MSARLSSFVLLLSFLLAASARSETIQVRTSRSDVNIQVGTRFEARWAYSPLAISIRNGDTRDHRWTFEFLSNGANVTRTTREVLDVAAGETRTFELVVPLGTEGGQMSVLSMRVQGFAVESVGWDYPLAGYNYEENANPALAFSTTLGESHPPGGSPFAPEELPSDWRGYLSLRALALAEEDWKAASPGARTALLEWTSRGGRLVRVESSEAARPDVEPFGLGTIVRGPVPGSEREWNELLSTGKAELEGDYWSWAKRSVAPIQTRSGLLLLFLVSYGVLIGPVNLFVLSPSGNRARLFWTMPAIAVLASLFLAVLIVLQDGLGGQGKRIVFVRLVPELTREVLVQEQVSRTGALLRRGFELPESVAVYDAQTDPGFSRGELSSDGRIFGGNWFRSRAIQAQRIEAVRPGRARVERTGERVLLSSIDDSLEALYYRDQDGRCYRAENVSPGRPLDMEPVDEKEYETFWRDLASQAGPAIRARLTAVYWERGAFLARAAGGRDSVALETLSSIDWEDAKIYSGRIVDGTTRGDDGI